MFCYIIFIFQYKIIEDTDVNAVHTEKAILQTKNLLNHQSQITNTRTLQMYSEPGEWIFARFVCRTACENPQCFPHSLKVQRRIVTAITF